MKNKLGGFTLIELMIVVVIVGILAAIALPAYQDSVRKGRRASAITLMLDMQLSQEKYRANNSKYAGSFASVGISSTYIAAHVDPAFYAFSLAASNTNPNYYLITATPQGKQASDKQYGVACTSLTLNQNNDKGPTGKEQCWRK